MEVAGATIFNKAYNLWTADDGLRRFLLQDLRGR